MGSQRVYAGARLADIDRRRARGCRLFSSLSWKSSRTLVSLLLYRLMMEAFVRTQNRRRFLEKRFDYLALVPAVAAICYPFLLNAFHAIVGTQSVSPPPLAIASAAFILVVAFVVPFLGIALA